MKIFRQQYILDKPCRELAAKCAGFQKKYLCTTTGLNHYCTAKINIAQNEREAAEKFVFHGLCWLRRWNVSLGSDKRANNLLIVQIAFPFFCFRNFPASGN